MKRAQEPKHKSPASRKRGGHGMKYLAALLALALLVFVGLRLKGWQDQRQEARTLVLVNPWNYVDETGFRPRLTGLGEGLRMDRSCAAALKSMLADCRAAGHQPQVLAAYRSHAEQERLYRAQVQKLIDGGLDEDTAAELAAETVARPGTCEHELGLAVDLADNGALPWLQENAWRYGFILRYPEGGEEQTGVAYHPGHFRYTGPDSAGQIYSLGITLEEYSALFYNEAADIVFDEAD